MKGLSTDQRRRFDERGLVKVEGLISPETAEAMAGRLWQALADLHGARRGEPATWKAEWPAKFGALQKSGAFSAMATPGLLALLDDLIGRDRWAPPPSWGLPLVRFPRAMDRWSVPSQVWHLDLTPDPKRRDMMVGRLFVLLAPLRAGGGGTLVATGSHRIVAALAEGRRAHLSSQEMRKRLAMEHPWFADLMSPPKGGEDRVVRFMTAATTVNGVSLQVEEVTGEPGDVFFMHPHALHAPAPCVLDTPRLALAQTVYPKGWF
jgi:hypothetical protein